jgi:LPXTG-motif cell wall-anchored protein
MLRKCGITTKTSDEYNIYGYGSLMLIGLAGLHLLKKKKSEE